MSYRSEVLADTPTVWYPLDEVSGTTAVDASGNSLDGTWSSAPTTVASIMSGETTSAKQLSGGTGGQYLTLPNLNLQNKSFTIEMWIARNNSTGDHYLFSNFESNATRKFVHCYLDTVAQTRFHFYLDDLIAPHGSVQNGATHHLVFRYDYAADLASIWIDGTKRMEGPHGPMEAIATSCHFFATAAGTLAFPGQAQHLAVYVNSALADARIVAHYTAGGGTLASPNAGNTQIVVTATQQVYYGSPMFTARLRVDRTKKIILDRQDNYGNVGIFKKDYLPNDDAYLHGPEITERLYDRANRLANRFGYDFGFNGSGQAYIKARNNATSFTAASTLGAADERVHPSALGGRYLYKRHTVDGTVQVFQTTGYMSRADLIVGIGEDVATGLNGGRLSVNIEYWNGSSWAQQSGYPFVFTTYRDGDAAFYYDDLLNASGANACAITLFSLPFNQYRVTVTLNGPDTVNDPSATDAVYRINGLDLFERDPTNGYFSQALSTLGNVVDITPESERKEQRNHIIVVGGRKAAVTDSAKNDITPPDTPETEFHVSVASNPASIYDPTATDYIGSKRTTVIFDNKVVDSDFASWLARTLLIRQRSPRASARIEHTVIPALELMDAINVVEEKYSTVSHTLWVEQFSEQWSPSEATTSLDATSFPEIPSYQPREDVDIDALFDHDGDGKGEPIVNLRISYKNIYGVTVANADIEAPTLLQSKADNTFAPMVEQAVSDPSTVLSQALIPETLYLRQYDAGNVDLKRVLINSPYRQFYTYTWGNKIPTIAFDFQEGDGSSQYTKGYYGFPATATWRICYDYFQTRTGVNPFYDPYTSEIGNYVSIKFDALLSGRYRVSLWYADKSNLLITRVAWLTRTDQDGEDENKHWQYMDAGADKEFVWDGVDNIGVWNQLQSLEQAEVLEGTFGDHPLVVEDGYYVWNDRSTSVHTQIGDAVDDNYPRSGGTPNGAPYYTIGQYGKFLVVVEVQNDMLMRRNNESAPRTVVSNNLPYTYLAGPNTGNPTGWHDVAQTYVWTHLGEPNQVELTMEDWVAGTPWSPGISTSSGDWGAMDADGTFRDGKPVRFTFNAVPRRGKLFEVSNVSSNANTNIKLNRRVTLKATIFDQFWTFFGKPWDQTTSEMKRLTNRMFHNEEHTLEFQDDAYRSGTDLASFEWIFQPSLFKKDFGNNRTERINYCDYEQLEALPGHSSRRSGGSSLAERAFINMAFMNYLFYMSAHTIDRSGRRQWCINRSFIDKSKIVTNTWLGATAGTHPQFTLNYPSARADRYLVRSIFTRQWKEPTWTSTYPGNPVLKNTITDAHQLAFVQPLVTSFDLSSTAFNHPTQAAASYDYHLRSYAVYSTYVITGFVRFGTSGGSTTAPVIKVPSTDHYYRALSGFGTWNFDRDAYSNFYTPSPSLDFHPYWRYPYMPDWSTSNWSRYYTDTDDPVYHQNVMEIAACSSAKAARDGAEQENWFGWTNSVTRGQLIYGGPGTEAQKLQEYGMRLERSAQDWIIQQKLNGAAIDYIFDYAKQDQLDRFDQFRGVFSRGKFSSRDRDDATYWETKRDRAASRRPVKAAGTNLLNLANYDRYYVAPAHDSLRQVNKGDTASYEMHFVGQVTDWFDIRFRSEYAWYNDQWFPTDAAGASAYAYFQNEITKAREYIGGFWWEDRGSPLYFDAGAWTGWKDDILSAAWTSDPKLRWNEASSISPTNKTYDTNSATLKWRYGGDTDTRATNFMGDASKQWVAANIFDEYLSHRWWRLAVGPRVPETKSLWMNLVLPERLKT